MQFVGDIVKVDVESLQRQLKEREDRENKLKQLTLKAKKESAELRNKVGHSVITQQLGLFLNGSYVLFYHFFCIFTSVCRLNPLGRLWTVGLELFPGLSLGV